MLQGTTDEVKEQAEQRIRSRFIMYVPDIHDLAFKKAQRDRRYEKSEESQKLKRAKYCLDSANNHNCGAIVKRHFKDEPYQKRTHEQGYTRTDME